MAMDQASCVCVLKAILTDKGCSNPLKRLLQYHCLVEKALLYMDTLLNGSFHILPRIGTTLTITENQWKTKPS